VSKEANAFRSPLASIVAIALSFDLTPCWSSRLIKYGLILVITLTVKMFRINVKKSRKSSLVFCVFIIFHHRVKHFFIFILDLLRTIIRDPEKPNTLEDLLVITDESVQVQPFEENGYLVRIDFNPTVPHCSLASLIGLCLRVKI
jgi:hypothetical protein